jgi:hypothetical protein
VAEPAYTVKPLDRSTWPAFDALVEANNGIFLFNGALSTYEQLGFARDRKIGKHRWVVTIDVAPS